MPKTKPIAAVLAAVITAAAPAYALSVKDFNTRTDRDKTVVITNFIDRMTGDLGRNNPQLAKNIHDYFFVTPTGQRFAEGLLNLEVELGALDRAASDGKVDLSRIEIEGVIVKVVKDKFPPPQ